MIDLIGLGWRERVEISLQCEDFYLQSKRISKFSPLHKKLAAVVGIGYTKELWVFITAACKSIRYGCTGSKFPLSSKRYYEANKKYNLNLSQTKTKELLTKLEDHNLITFYKGFKDISSGWSMSSCFIMSDLLIDMIPEDIAKRYALVRQPEDYVKIKDYNRKTYITDTRGYSGIRMIMDDMKRFNDFLDEQIITIEGVVRKFTYIRIFADNLSGSGRFYTSNGFMNYEADLRKTITINSESVTEVDLSNLHPRCAYTMNGIKIPEDWDAYCLHPTILEGSCRKQLRKLTKKAMMCCLYSENKEEALRSLYYEYNKNKYEDGLYDKVVIASKAECVLILNNLEVMHQRIVDDWFYKPDGWKKLQNIDSRLCSYVVNQMVYLKEVCLPYHDSWVVCERNRALLISIMEDSWVNLFGSNVNFKYEVEF
jgi:hypothetical protein